MFLNYLVMQLQFFPRNNSAQVLCGHLFEENACDSFISLYAVINSGNWRAGIVLGPPFLSRLTVLYRSFKSHFACLRLVTFWILKKVQDRVQVEVGSPRLFLLLSAGQERLL